MTTRMKGWWMNVYDDSHVRFSRNRLVEVIGHLMMVLCKLDLKWLCLKVVHIREPTRVKSTTPVSGSQ